LYGGKEGGEKAAGKEPTSLFLFPICSLLSWGGGDKKKKKKKKAREGRKGAEIRSPLNTGEEEGRKKGRRG